MLEILKVKTTPLHRLGQMILILGSLGISSPLRAALPVPESLDWGASTLSFAGSGAAMPSDHDAFLTNPALLFYYVGKNAGGGTYRSLPGNNRMWNLSVVDGTSLSTAAGFQFSWADFGPSRRLGYTTGAAYRTPYGVAGATLQALDFSDVGSGNGWHFTGSFGVFVPVAGGLSLGAYTKHFFDMESNSKFPPDIHLAALYVVEDYLRLTFEAGKRFEIPNQDWNYSTAADLLFQRFFAIRGGYRWDQSQGDDFWSLGGAVLSEKAEIVGFFMRTTEAAPKNGFGFSATYKY